MHFVFFDVCQPYSGNAAAEWRHTCTLNVGFILWKVVNLRVKRAEVASKSCTGQFKFYGKVRQWGLSPVKGYPKIAWGGEKCCTSKEARKHYITIMSYMTEMEWKSATLHVPSPTKIETLRTVSVLGFTCNLRINFEKENLAVKFLGTAGDYSYVITSPRCSKATVPSARSRAARRG